MYKQGTPKICTKILALFKIVKKEAMLKVQLIENNALMH
jgi:hypothetical protein